MIRVRCPKCDKKLQLDDSLAGSVGNCPDCRQRFRVPGEAPRAKARAGSGPARRTSATADDDFWEEDSSPYAVKDEPQPTVPKELRRQVSEDEEALEGSDEDVHEDDFAFDREYAALQKKKRAMARKEETRKSIVFAISMVFVWIGLALYAFFQKDWAIGPLIGAAVISLTGSIWLIVDAFKEGAGYGVLVLFVPFYDCYYAITHWDTGGIPLMLRYFGVFMAGTVFLVGGADFEKMYEPVKRLYSAGPPAIDRRIDHVA